MAICFPAKKKCRVIELSGERAYPNKEGLTQGSGQGSKSLNMGPIPVLQWRESFFTQCKRLQQKQGKIKGMELMKKVC